MTSEKSTLSEQIYNSLKQDILSQKIAMGQKLTLQVLKDHFQVSHTPIREALTRLAEDGLVTYYSNRGVTVTTFTKQDIRELYQFMGELDAMAIQFCKLTYSHELLLYELRESMTENALPEESTGSGQNDLIRQKQSSDHFHFIFYKYAENTYLNQAAEKLRARIELISNQYYHEENIGAIERHHMEIYKAVEAKDYDKAADLMKKHLQYDMFMALKIYDNVEGK